MIAAEHCEQHEYIYIPEILPLELCKDLSDHLFQLKDKGELSHDSDCPLSFSIYGDTKFNAVLESLAERISEILNYQVLPTYTYARLYKHEEILKRHTDRAPCEISITVTLDHDKNSEVWPIIMGENILNKKAFSIREISKEKSICIEKGDGIIYKGCEVEHWREQYLGAWQTQGFFHFVNSEGPYQDYGLDKRFSLDHK